MSTLEDVCRNGFTYGFGRFLAGGRVERVEGARLRAMFLPRLTPEATRLLREHRYFVRAQLQHYGVDFDEQEFSGNGTHLLKKSLQAGKCDVVPEHLEALRLQMHTEWLENQSDRQLADHPEWVMEKYFVDRFGKPETTKTAEVVGIPYPHFSTHRSGQLRQAVAAVPGLHHATGRGSTTQTVYLGWSRAAVEKAAKEHAVKEARQLKTREIARQAERAAKHEQYLATAKKLKHPIPPSPVGQYMIDCHKIEHGWSEDIFGDLTAAIRATSTPGIYEATFDFGVITGMMILGPEESSLEEFCAQNKNDGDSDSEEDDGEGAGWGDESSDECAAGGSKRKSAVGDGGSSSKDRAKKAKTGRPGKPKKYLLRLKSRDTGTGEICTDATKGMIRFNGPDLSSFTAEADMDGIGDAVPFTGRKISASPAASHETWSDYSWNAYERARIGRWR